MRITTVMMWFWTVSIGVVVALLAFSVIYGIGQISVLKFQLVMCTCVVLQCFEALLDADFENTFYLAPFGVMLLVNLVLALLTMILIVVMEVRRLCSLFYHPGEQLLTQRVAGCCWFRSARGDRLSQRREDTAHCAY